MCYRLSIEPVQPDFSLSLAADSFVLEKGKPLEISVNVAARDGFKGPIEISAIGLPPGVTEIGCHPATAVDLETTYGPERVREVATLCDPRVRAAVERAGVALRSYGTYEDH